jgi:uroporphyrinogen decarboxylase
MTGLLEHSAEVHRLIEFSTEAILRHMQLYTDLGVHGFVLSDPTASGDLISPHHYAEYAAPPTRIVVEALRKAGMPSILHVCGKTARILPLVAETGATAFSFDASVDTAVVKQAVGASMCLLGNVDPVGLLLDGSPGTVKEEARSCISKGWAGGGFALAGGCDLSLHTPIENIRAMIEAGHEARY